MPATPKSTTGSTVSAGAEPTSAPAVSIAATTVAATAGTTGDTASIDVSAWSQLGLHPRLLAEVQRVAMDVARVGARVAPSSPSTADAAERADGDTKASGTPKEEAETAMEDLALCLSTIPSALLARVLTRTTNDFADVLVDGRCACGVDNQHHTSVKKTSTSTNNRATTTVTYNPATGTTAAIWMDNNASAAAAAAAVDPPTVTDEESVWQRDPTGVGRAIFNRPSAVAERRLLVLLYALHVLLTAAAPASPGREAIGVLIASTPQSARRFARSFRELARACGVELVVVEDGHQPPAAAASTPCGPHLYVTTMIGFLKWDYVAFLREGCAAAVENTTPTKAAHPPQPARFLAVVAVEDLAYSFFSTDAQLQGTGTTLAETAMANATVASGGASNAALGARVRACAAGRWPAAEKAWDAALALAQLHTDQRTSTPAGSGGSGGTGAAAPAASTALPRTPCLFWVTVGPISCLSPLARSRLSRRHRRYYPLSTSTYLSAAEAAITASGPGTTAPLSSTRMIYLFSTDDKDKEAQLQTILKQTHLFKRILLLTHHKEVRQLYSLIQHWGLFSPATTGYADEPSTDGSSAHSTNKAAPSTAGRQFFLLRTDIPERSTNLLLDFCSPPLSSPAAEDSPHETELLVGWDSFTAVDLMDVDCVIQYFPPQKSQTDREWAEFIQNLHTTGDTEADIEFSLYSNPNNTEKNINMKIKQLHEELGPSRPGATHYRSAARRHTKSPATAPGASTTASGTMRCGIRPPTIITMMGPPDLSLTAFFMHQYYYSGGCGSLSAGAANASLAAAVQTGGGTTGLPEAVVASHSASHVPVLNVSSTHPWFVPLVCGGPAAAETTTAPAAVEGIDGKPLSASTVLKKKIALERCEQLRNRRDLATSPLPYMIPCLFANRETPRSGERVDADGAAGVFPTAPTSTAASSASAAGSATAVSKSATNGGSATALRGTTAAPAAGGASSASGNSNKASPATSGGGKAAVAGAAAAAKSRSAPAATPAPAPTNAASGKKKNQPQKDARSGSGDVSTKAKQGDARTSPLTDSSNNNSTGGGGGKGASKKSRSRKKGGGGST